MEALEQNHHQQVPVDFIGDAAMDHQLTEFCNLKMMRRKMTAFDGYFLLLPLQGLPTMDLFCAL